MHEGELTVCDEALIKQVLDACFTVHKALEPGLLESVYELALMVELAEIGITARRQVEVPVSYKGVELGTGFKADIIVENSLVLELKAVQKLDDVHLA